MLSGRRYRLALTDAQESMCAEFGDLCRAVWNTALDQRRQYVDRYTRGRQGPFCGYHLQAAQLVEAKTEETWLKAAPSHVLQQTLKDLDRACAGKGTFNVEFRAKYRWSPSFRFPAGNLITVEKLNRKWSRAKLPKLGWVRLRASRPIGGVIRAATVSRKGGHWFISFLVEDGLLTPEHHPGTPVGVDRGVKVAATLSTGEFHDRPYVTPGEKSRYLRLQRKLSRSKKGSANRAKMLKSMGRITTRAVDRHPHRAGRPRLHLADVLSVQGGGRPLAREPSRVRVHLLWPHRPRRCERGQEHPSRRRACGVSLRRPRGHPVREAGTSAPARAGAPTGVAAGGNPPPLGVGRKSSGCR